MSAIPLTDEDVLRRADELVSHERICMLSCLADNGQLHSKPMTVLAHEPGGPYWFYIAASPGDTATEQAHARVNLAFCHAARGRFVSLAGSGQVVRDRSLIRAMWTPMAKPWFPEGPEAADLALLAVTAEHVAFWDGPSNLVTRTLAIAASVVAGKPVGLGEHGAANVPTLAASGDRVGNV